MKLRAKRSFGFRRLVDTRWDNILTVSRYGGSRRNLAAIRKSNAVENKTHNTRVVDALQGGRKTISASLGDDCWCSRYHNDFFPIGWYHDSGVQQLERCRRRGKNRKQNIGEGIYAGKSRLKTRRTTTTPRNIIRKVLYCTRIIRAYGRWSRSRTRFPKQNEPVRWLLKTRIRFEERFIILLCNIISQQCVCTKDVNEIMRGSERKTRDKTEKQIAPYVQILATTLLYTGRALLFARHALQFEHTRNTQWSGFHRRRGWTLGDNRIFR